MTSIEGAVEGIASRADRAGIFLDVDGTLAPIVPRPELVRVLPEVHPVLARLSNRLPVIALVSGRRSEDVRALVDVEGVEIVGTHDLEAAPSMDPDLLQEIEAAAATVGAWVEAKGAAAAVHFRGLADPEAAAASAAERLAAVAAAHGLEVLAGKQILELVPAGRARKGGAVERIAEERSLEAVLFAGDDVSDLDAFAALGRLRARGLWTCAVAVRGADAPSEVEAAADLSVDGPEGAVALLATIAERLGEGPGSRG